MRVRTSCTCGQIVEADDGRMGPQVPCPGCDAMLTERHANHEPRGRSRWGPWHADLLVTGAMVAMMGLLLPVVTAASRGRGPASRPRSTTSRAAQARARACALQVSCGSNLRQFAYACIGYSNDFKEKLPDFHRNKRTARIRHQWVRLPIDGFDTATLTPPGKFAGGLAYVARHYLKNDWDIVFCPDGWFEKKSALRRNVMTVNTGYCYVANLPAPLPEPSKKEAPGKRAPGVARTASDRPELLIAADMIALAGTPPTTIATNHLPPGNADDRPKTPRGQANPRKWLKHQPDKPGLLPLGGNQVRLDCRVRWIPWQDVTPRYLFKLQGVRTRYWW